jgi:protocatechuate 3,4-dioxygenase beta subunit
MKSKPVLEQTTHHKIESDNDDAPVGRILNRREVLALFGFAGASLLAACTVVTPVPNAESATAVAIGSSPTAEATTAAEVTSVAAANASTAPSCVVRPEMTEGPYFVDGQMERSDIRIEPTDGSVKPGIPLTLAFAVSQISNSTCAPLAGATIDVWHCDATGVYSDVSDPGFNTQGQTWLRGYQVTDEQGLAQFTTIYPGWYPGRTVHIHFKIRTTVTGNETYEFTSQFFFDDSLSDQVFTNAPYNSKGQRNTLNSNDNIYAGGGDQMTLNLIPVKSGDVSSGFTTNFEIALDLSDTETGKSDSAGRGGGPGRPGGPPPNGMPPNGTPPNGTPPASQG